jgi:catalase (peroxidase I)
MENTYGTGNGADTIQADLKVLGLLPPVTWSNYFENLFGFEWELTKSPAGAHHSNLLAMLVLEPFLMRMTQRKHINLSYSD